MIFSFFRSLRRSICFYLVIAALIVLLKYEFPQVGKTVGCWISGLGDTRIAQAFSSMLSNLSEGNGLADSVEVFYDSVKTAN